MLLVLIIVGGVVKIVAALNEKTVREAQEERFPVELARYLERDRRRPARCSTATTGAAT